MPKKMLCVTGHILQGDLDGVYFHAIMASTVKRQNTNAFGFRTDDDLSVAIGLSVQNPNELSKIQTILLASLDRFIKKICTI